MYVKCVKCVNHTPPKERKGKERKGKERKQNKIKIIKTRFPPPPRRGHPPISTPSLPYVIPSQTTHLSLSLPPSLPSFLLFLLTFYIFDSLALCLFSLLQRKRRKEFPGVALFRLCPILPLPTPSDFTQTHD